LNKIDKCLLILLILTIISSSECLDNENNETNTHNEYEILVAYNIIINANSTEEYFVYVPIIVRPDNATYEIMENLSIKEGSPKFQIIHTKYGKALNISGRGNIWINGFHREKLTYEIRMNNSRFPGNFIDFNLWTDNETINSGLGNIWTYGKISKGKGPVNVDIELTIGNIRHRAIFEINNKWNPIEVNIEPYITP